MGTVTALHTETPAGRVPPVGDAVAAWADELRTTRQRSGQFTSAATIRSYRDTIQRITRPDQPVSDLDTDDERTRLQTRFRGLWSGASASTWNTRRAAVRAFVAYAHRQGWLATDPAAGLDRQHTPPGLDRVRSREDIRRLVTDRKRHAARDRCLWAVLYDTFARADEILDMNVEDLDLGNRQGWITRKGGHRERVSWTPETARLLSRQVRGRSRGPVFLTARKAKGADRGEVNPRDLDPDTGRGRLAYDAALKTFRAATGGWSFHDLRHSAITHALEDGVDLPVVMTKSGHRDLRSLARYARPSLEHAQAQIEQARGN